MKNSTLLSLMFLSFIPMSLWIGIWTSWAIACFIYVMFDFFAKNRPMPIGELSFLISGFQWLISPLIAYLMGVELSTPIEIYMRNTSLMYSAFMIGYYTNRRDNYLYKDFSVEMSSRVYRVAKAFIVIGIVFFILQRFYSNFVIELCKEMIFVGTLILMYAKPSKSIYYASVTLGVFLLYCIGTQGYHELIVWGIIYTMGIFSMRNTKVYKKVVLIMVALLMVNTLQTVKFAVREQGNTSISFFVTSFLQNIFMQSSENTETNVSERFNQGWIISDIYYTIPSKRDYYYGETIGKSLVSSALPEFLYDDRSMDAEVSKKYFTEFTGHQLNSGTSMGLSVLGEAYGNFGLYYGSLFMLIWGVFIAWVMKNLNRLSRINILWFFFIPIICHDLFKAELSFFKVFNWTIKGFIFAWIFIFFINRFYGKLTTKNA